MEKESTSKLTTSLSNESRTYRKIARMNATGMYGLYALSIGSSFSAAILVALDTLPAVILSILTALPGTAILAATVLRLKDHARWHFIKARRIENLLYSLQFEDTPPAKISEQFRAIHAEMESTWPGFGNLGFIEESFNYQSTSDMKR